VFNLNVSAEHYMARLSIGFNAGLAFPYLMHQLLAISARHLAFAQPRRASNFSHQAVVLQTRALSLFNGMRERDGHNVDQSNCVAMVLFAAVLSRHILADTLAQRDPENSLETFLDRFQKSMAINKGVHTVAAAAWPLLMESELASILTSSSDFNRRTPIGSHITVLTEKLERRDAMNTDEREACLEALRLLQVGLDAVLKEEEDKDTAQFSGGNRYNMVFNWTMSMPSVFADMLAAKRIEALAVLGHYALLLFHAKDLWQVQDAGAYLLDLILGYLPPEWHGWLECPRREMALALRAS
jgi:hypothetical protein